MKAIEAVETKFERFFEWLNEDGEQTKKSMIVLGMFVVMCAGIALVGAN